MGNSVCDMWLFILTSATFSQWPIWYFIFHFNTLPSDLENFQRYEAFCLWDTYFNSGSNLRHITQFGITNKNQILTKNFDVQSSKQTAVIQGCWNRRITWLHQILEISNESHCWWILGAHLQGFCKVSVEDYQECLS